MNSPATGVRLPPPGSYTVDPDRSSITFATRHLFGLGAVTGSFAIRAAELVVADPVTLSTVTVEVDAGSFNTGSTGRDEKVRSASFLGVPEDPTTPLSPPASGATAGRGSCPGS